MVRSDFRRTIAVNVSGLTASHTHAQVSTLLVEHFPDLIVCAVQFVGHIAKVTFDCEEAKHHVLQHQAVVLDGVSCEVREDGPRQLKVLVYNYPFEANDNVLKDALGLYGEVFDVCLRHWTHLEGVCDGVRMVSMILSRPIPRNIVVNNYEVKIAYYGQVPECDICKETGHIAKNCPIKGKCRKCFQPGHLARDCPTVPRTWSEVVHPGRSDSRDNLVQFARSLDDPTRDVDLVDTRDNQLDEVDSQSQSVLAPVFVRSSSRVF